MFGISFEHILIVGVILLIVGPKRLPELGNTMGKAIKNFKDSFNGVEEARFKRLEEEKAAAQKTANINTAAPANASSDAVDAEIKPATKTQA